MHSQLMQTFSKLLRAVVIPNKDGLLLSAVDDEYYGMTGERIPFRQLGYQNTHQLLLSNPQLASIDRLPDGNLIVRVTSDSKTDHIKEMVSRQKDNNEGFNKHTRRVIQNNNNYLYNRNIGRYCEAQVNQESREIVGSRRRYGDNGAEVNKEKKEEVRLVRSQVREKAELSKSHEKDKVKLTGRDVRDEADEEEESSGRKKMKVTRVVSPEKIYLQTPAQIADAKRISRLLGEEMTKELYPSVVKMKMHGDPEPRLQVAGRYAARLYDDWLRVTVVGQIPGSDEVTLRCEDYHVYEISYLVINVYDLPESLDFSAIPAAVSKMSLSGLRKPVNFTGWDRELVKNLKKTIIRWETEGGVYADENDESDTFQLYNIQGSSLSDLVNQNLLRIGDVMPSESFQDELREETEAAEGTADSASVTLTIVVADEQLWYKLSELAQLIQTDPEEVVEGLRQINVTLSPANLLPLRCLPKLFDKMDVPDDIIIEVTSQIKNAKRSG